MDKNDASNGQGNRERAYLYALIDHLIDNGIMDVEEFRRSLQKWFKNLEVDGLGDPLGFLKPKPKIEVVDDLSPPEHRYTVLIVDDLKFMRELIRSTLSANGFTIVAEAENGYEAVEKFKTHRPDIVITDIEMKGMNGLEVLNAIRAIDRNVPVIIMTGHPEREYVQKALSYGMTDFIVKPLDVNRLLAVLKQFTQKKK